MHKIYKIVMYICIIFVILQARDINVYAETVYNNEENGNIAIVEDREDLLSEDEENILQLKLEKITKYGNVAFITCSDGYSSTSEYIKDYYREIFGKKSGTVFMIDMRNRNIYIFSDGKMYKTITKSYANVITDNTYKYATDGKYFECADKTFEQIYSLLRGEKIAQPMKYICNAILAILIALLANYFIARKLSASQKIKNEQLIEGMSSIFDINDADIQFIRQTKRYTPKSRGGGGSGGGGSGGGGGHGF